jgi:pimeloyl-ACP methyl ester carboxylesterase
MTIAAGGGWGAGRDTEEDRILKVQIDAFVARYGTTGQPAGRKVIILFPGGMGSRLLRSTAALGGPQPFNYRLAWLACSIAWGDATNLQFQGDHDYKDFYVVPQGAVDLVVMNPYEGIIDWCDKNDVDLFILGWDWRRSVAETVTYFFSKFMPALEGALHAPLRNFTLVGHSQGGMVVKAIANCPAESVVQRMDAAITVAAPFYGYLGQLPRFFNGDPDLNWTEGNTGASTITGIVSTMPGAYELMCLEKASYDANKAGFNDPAEDYPLPDYPSMDADDPGEAADPYNPVPYGQGASLNGKVRYMQRCGFDWNMLAAGRNTVRAMSAPLAPAVAAKFHCVRGVQNVGGKDVLDTIVSQKWQRVPVNFNPDTDASPFTDQKGPGDGTQPAWTTRLLGLPKDHTITLRGNLDHMTMMNELSVHQAIGTIMGLGKDLVVIPTPAQLVASRNDMDELLDELRKIPLEVSMEPEDRQKAIRTYLQQFTRKQRFAFLARAFVDALKAPSQKTGYRDRPLDSARPDVDNKPR